MTHLTQHPTADLQLRLQGGGRDGELVSIPNTKCMLGFETGNGQTPPCAVIRGPRGVAIRGLGQGVRVNGTLSSVHWLNPGDRIELGPELTATVEHLGSIGPANAEVDATASPESNRDREEDPVPARPVQQEVVYSPLDHGGQVLASNAAATESPVEPASEQPYPTLPDRHEPATGTDVPSPSSHDGPAANEAVGKLLDSLTHSSLANGSSPAGPDAIGSDDEVDRGSDLEFRSLAEQLKAELAAEMRAESEARQQRQSSPSDQRDASQPPPVDAAGMVEAPADRDLQPAERTNAEDIVQTVESVTELLNRMKAEGQWDGLEDDQPSQFSGQPQPVTNAKPEPKVNLAGKQPPLTDSEEADGVNDYMAQLLSRTGSGRSSSTPPKVWTPPSEKRTVKKTPEAVYQAPSNPFGADEFVPRKKAEQPKSLDAMRELANTSTREAIASFKINRRKKALGHTRVAVGVVSFLLAVYFFTFQSTELLDLWFNVGLACLGVAGLLAAQFYLTIVYNETIDAEQARLDALKNASRAATETGDVPTTDAVPAEDSSDPVVAGDGQPDLPEPAATKAR